MPHEGMAGRQIRWKSVGRAAAVAAAVIAGVISLPALLGSDKPPPVPADVGLVPPPAQSPPATEPPPAPAAPPLESPKGGRRDRHRLATRDRRREHSHHRQQHSHSQHRQHRQPANTPPAPVTSPTYAPPVYSYVPPPRTDEFGIER